MMPSTHPTFGTWLKKKSMSVKNFSEWIKNSIEPLPFCHWEEDIYAGIVIELVRCSIWFKMYVLALFDILPLSSFI